ncbi:VOC family protein [Phytoactinopolyspora limicola]|uniref:VOC family protein n=1 Tax=Phytoactinopolyspora limicola TaxID=2715536 RepID=UPI00140BA28E|nr:VOC family protein [Phytoactinopolyspora limicola]
MISDIQVVNVPVSDQDVAYRFYVDTLGLRVVADQEGGPHGRWLQVAAKSGTTTLALTGAGDQAGSVSGLVFTSDDIDADVAALRQRGVEFPSGIQDMPWARAAQFADPDGNQLVLQTAT